MSRPPGVTDNGRRDSTCSSRTSISRRQAPTAARCCCSTVPAGNEHELLPLAQAILPTAGVLSPRGQIDDDGRWRFFRRFAEGRVRPRRPAAPRGAARRIRRSGRPPLPLRCARGRRDRLLGWSDAGVDVVAGVARHACGRRAFQGCDARECRRGCRSFPRRRCWLPTDSTNPVVQPEDTLELAALLRVAGADVSVALQPAAQQIVPADVDEARGWLTSCGTLRSPLRMS